MDDRQAKSAAAPPKPPIGAPIRSSKSRKPQFSLRAMLIATTAFAAVAAVSGVIGLGAIATLAVAIAVLFVIPASLAALAFYSRGHRQTFFAGCFAGSLFAHYLHDGFSWGDSIGEAAILTLSLAATILATGFAALQARRFVEHRGWDREHRDE